MSNEHAEKNFSDDWWNDFNAANPLNFLNSKLQILPR